MKILFSWKKFWGYPIIVGTLCLACAIFLGLSITSYVRVADQASTMAQGEKRTIILDAGHGGEDGGTSSKSGLLEKDINLSIAQKLQALLVSSGFEVIMIRDTDVAVGDANLSTVKERKVSDLKKRLQIMNEHPDALFISIHQNHFEQSQYHGTQVFYSANHEAGKLLADSIQSSVVSLLQSDNNRVTKAAEKSIYLLWNSKTPSVIVECGFLSNETEAQKLSEQSYQKQMAFSIFCGILNYENGNQPLPSESETASNISSNLI
ncbi:MAG: N-acetylmuramoyl-L-alanine amidase [Clostridiales bacterium]|nr:N-acetylmuramoyl-L-alanine amidase [Clostridiales bacterium]